MFAAAAPKSTFMPAPNVSKTFTTQRQVASRHQGAMKPQAALRTDIPHAYHSKEDATRVAIGSCVVAAIIGASPVNTQELQMAMPMQQTQPNAASAIVKKGPANNAIVASEQKLTI